MLHALPGMGADRRMYSAPWAAIPEFVAHDWICHSGEATIAQVAEAMCASCGIRDGDTLVGSSLGGMVACEITKIRSIPRLYLVGSATRREEINTLLSVLHPLARIAPLDWLQFSAGKIPTELAQMFSSTDASFVRAMCDAVFKWQGLGTTKTKVFRIHGKHDLVIPAPAQVDLLLDGGHLISLTHAQMCAEFIRANQALEPTPIAVTPRANARVAPATGVAHL
jgi:pimeloyl-ACP methyl ester carboxylesterase